MHSGSSSPIVAKQRIPPPSVERGSPCLSAYNNKVNCHLAARRSSNGSKTDPSAQAADLVLFNEMTMRNFVAC